MAANPFDNPAFGSSVGNKPTTGNPFDDPDFGKPRSALGEIGSQIKAGVVAELPRQFGQALQYATNPGNPIYEYGKGLAARSKLRGEQPDLAPQPEEHNAVTNALAGGGRMLAPSIAAPAAIGLGAAALPVSVPTAATIAAIAGAVPAAFQQGQQTLDKAAEKGISDDVAIPAARKTALIEGAGEAAANLVGAKLVGAFFKPTAAQAALKAAEAATTPAEKAAALATARQAVADSKILPAWGRSVGEAAVLEPTTEFGQQYGQALVEKNAGIDNQDPLHAGLEVIPETLGMTALLAPFGLAGHAMAKSRAQRSIAAEQARLTASTPPTPPAAPAAPVIDPIQAAIARAEQGAPDAGGTELTGNAQNALANLARRPDIYQTLADAQTTLQGLQDGQQPPAPADLSGTRIGKTIAQATANTAVDPMEEMTPPTVSSLISGLPRPETTESSDLSRTRIARTIGQAGQALDQVATDQMEPPTVRSLVASLKTSGPIGKAAGLTVETGAAQQAAVGQAIVAQTEAAKATGNAGSLEQKPTPPTRPTVEQSAVQTGNPPTSAVGSSPAAPEGGASPVATAQPVLDQQPSVASTPPVTQGVPNAGQVTSSTSLGEQPGRQESAGQERPSGMEPLQQRAQASGPFAPAIAGGQGGPQVASSGQTNELQRESSGASNDLVTLYHGTTEDAARQIFQDGRINGGSYFGVPGKAVALSPSREKASEYGDGTVVKVQVPRQSLVVDPESNDNPDVGSALRNGASVYAVGDHIALPQTVSAAPSGPQVAGQTLINAPSGAQEAPQAGQATPVATTQPATPQIQKTAPTGRADPAGYVSGVLQSVAPDLVAPVQEGVAKGRIVLENSIDGITRRFAENENVSVEEARRQLGITEQSAGDDINGLYHNGKAYLLTGNLTRRNLLGVLYHESTHGRDRARLNQRAQSLIRSRDNAKHTPQMKALLGEVARRMESAGQTNNPREAMTYLVEVAAQVGRFNGSSRVDGRFLMAIDKVSKPLGDFVRDLVSSVRAAMLKRGVNFNPTVDDLLAVAHSNVKDFAKKGALPRGGQTPEFSRGGQVDKHVLQVVRGERKTGDKTTLDAGEKLLIRGAAKKMKMPISEVEKQVRGSKAAHPVEAGWAPLKFIGANTDPDTGKSDLKYQTVPYSFNQDATGKSLKPGTKPYTDKVSQLGQAMTEEVRAVYDRAQSGDKASQNIIGQSGWYKEMRTRLRMEFGGLGDLFADLLGATSPNTPVRTNWDNSVEALRLATTGAFDNLMPQWVAWANNVDAINLRFRTFFDEMLARGMSKNAIKKLDEYKSLAQVASEARKFPDSLLPLKENGKKFGFNGQNVVRAMVDLWRVVENANPDINLGGTAPKAINFSGNLIGFRTRATIDVWAARMLQRISGGPRIPSMAEGGVSGSALKNGQNTLQFGFGQDVFSDAVKKIRNDKVMGKDATLKGVNDDDLQALVWFIEKEIWTKNNWTSAAGEGGSFEFEADLAGVRDRNRVNELRKLADSSVASTEKQRAEAKQEIQRLQDEMAAMPEIAKADAVLEANAQRMVANKTAPKGQKLTKEEQAAIRQENEAARKAKQKAKTTKAYKELESELTRAKAVLKKPTVEERQKIRADAVQELGKIARPLTRYTGGLSIQKGAEQGMEPTPPSDADMATLAQNIIDSIIAGDPGATVVGLKAIASEGRYGAPERTLDFEAIVRDDFDPRPMAKKTFEAAQEGDQDAAFVARVLRPDENFDPLQHRPGIEIYFRDMNQAQAAAKMLAEIGGMKVSKPTEMGPSFFQIGGYTVIVDGRPTQEAKSGQMGKPVGMRVLYMPEYEARYGIDSRLKDATDAELSDIVKKRAADLVDFADAVLRQYPGVSFAGRVNYEVDSRFAGEYQGAIDGYASRATEGRNRAGQGTPWRGRSNRESIAAATGRLPVNADQSRAELPGIDRASKEQGVETPDFSRGETSPTFYSALSAAIPKAPWSKSGELNPTMLRGWIDSRSKDGTFKPDEVEWSGIKDWLQLQQGKVTREQVQDYLRQNGVKVEETMLGGENARTLSDPAIAKQKKMLEDAEIFPDTNPDDPNSIGFILGDGEILGVPEMARFVGDPDYPEITPEVVEAARDISDYYLGSADEGNARPKFATYTLPGGQNYRELLLRLPPAKPGPLQFKVGDTVTLEMGRAKGKIVDITLDPGLKPYTIEVDGKRGFYHQSQIVGGIEQSSSAKAFLSPHFDQPNVLAHIRFNDRTDADGKKVLFIEEIQSDWAQKGRKVGFLTAGKQAKLEDLSRERLIEILRFNDPNGSYTDQESEAEGLEPLTKAEALQLVKDEIAEVGDSYNVEQFLRESANVDGVPAAPFIGKTEAWVALALKRMIRYAAENGYDRVAFVNGQQSADRYDLSKQVSAVYISKNTDGKYDLSVQQDREGGSGLSDVLLEEFDIPLSRIEELVGKDLAKKAEAQTKREAEYRGLDLKVGGEGMKSFYDKIVPNVANDVLKKLGGGKVGAVTIPDAKAPDTYRAVKVTSASGIPFSHPFTARWKAEQFIEEQATKGNDWRLEVTPGTPLAQPGFDITDSMRDKALAGMPLFSKQAKYRAGRTVQLNDRNAEVVLTERARRRGDRLVMVDPAAFDRAFSKEDHFYIGLAGAGGIGTRYADFGRFVATGQPIEASEVAVQPNGRIGFGNGRHRYAWMRDNGAAAIPVSMDAESIAHAKQFGYLAGGRNLAKPQSQTDTPQFKAWFGGSKVVNAAGKPLIVYHGTGGRGAGLTEFRRGGNGFFGRGGIYFTNLPEAAEIFADNYSIGSNIMPVYLALKNPYFIGPEDSTNVNIEALKRQGYDGIIAPSGFSSEDAPNETMYVAFNPEQIKSATGNNGNFDSTNPDIRFSRAEGPTPTDIAEADQLISTQQDNQNIKWDNVETANDWLSDDRSHGDEYLADAAQQIYRERGGEKYGISNDVRDFVASALMRARNMRTEDEMSDGEPQFSKDMPAWVEAQPAGMQDALRKTGVWTPKLTLKQRLNELLANANVRLARGLADQFAPIKEFDEKAYMLARLTKSSDGGIEALLRYGVPFLNSAGAVDINPEKGGFIAAMQKLGGEHDRFFAWIAGNRAAQLKASGRENLFTDQDISSLSSLNQGNMDDGKSRAMVYRQAQAELNRYSKSVLDIAEKAGMINGPDRAIWESDFYVPFYRVLEEEGVKGPRNVSGLTNQYAFKKLRGGKEDLNDLLGNTLRNWSHLLSSALNNQAATAALKAGEDMGVAYPIKEAESGKGDPFVMENGQKQYWRVEDPYLLMAISSLDATPFTGAIPKIMGKFKHALTLGVTVSPTFRVNNLIRDSIQAIAANKMTYNVGKNLVQGWKATDTDNPVYGRMLAGGALMHFGTGLEGDNAAHTKRLIEAGVKDATILNSPEKVKAGLSKAWDWWEKTGSRSENVNRAAIYKQTNDRALAEGKTADEAHLLASYAARDSMDFSMQGAWPAVRLLTQVVPFLNARGQGLYKLGREGFAPATRVIYNTLTGQPVEATDKQKAKRFGAVVGATALASIALLLAYKDDEDWKRREEWDRDGFWWFKVGDTAMRIPKPFEVGALASVAERGLEMMMDGMDSESRTRFAKRLGAILMDNLSMNPIPQVFKPAIDLYANKDSFTGRDIETPSMERLSKSERIGGNTSAVAQLAGKAGILSPVQIDHLVRSYLGWLGAHAVMTADMAVRPMMGLADKPERKVSDMFVIGDFVKDLPANQSRYVTEFYDQAKTIQQHYADYRHAIATGQLEKAKGLLQDNAEDMKLHGIVQQTQQALAKVNQQIRRVEQSNDSPEVKRAKLDQLAATKNRLAEGAINARKRAVADR